jgi:hypothetical protein
MMHVTPKKRLHFGLLFMAFALGLGLIACPRVQAQSEGEVMSEVEPSIGCKKEEALCVAWLFVEPTKKMANLAVPKYEEPTRPEAVKRTVTYHVETRGNITANVNEFKTLAAQTYHDQRGWSRSGISFSEVASGGDFTLVLAEANEVAAFSTGCSSDYSCNVGRYVIINQDRWLGATPSWNSANGSLRDYRHMVVNHETGHWLGNGHRNCGGAGQPAPVMQQQSIDLQGCVFNPWPLDFELTSSRLGI